MNFRSRQQILPAFAVFAVTFTGWLGMRWYQSSGDVSASLSTDNTVYRCDCSCGSTRETVDTYGDTLESEEAGQCLGVNGTKCTDPSEPLLAYSNCTIGGKEIPGGVVEPR
jgi:hypothetical protein